MLAMTKQALCRTKIAQAIFEKLSHPVYILSSLSSRRQRRWTIPSFSEAVLGSMITMRNC